MKVTLLSHTPDALDVLIFTKNTRLTMSGRTLDEIRAWPMEKKMAELAYMKNTIQSSWEFVDYIFAIEGVTRAFTHQLVRHRVGTSFAQQAQRVVNMEGFMYLATGRELNMDEYDWSERPSSRRDRWGMASALENPSNLYDQGMQVIDETYKRLLQIGVKPQDARGILPTNILTTIVFKANLRTLHEMALKRLCVKAQGEFQDVFWEIVRAVESAHPWAEPFLRVQCAWNGTCLFPSLPVDQCHVKPHVYNPETAKAYGDDAGYDPASVSEIYQIHRAKRTEIQPVVAAT
jgi:flavin-dependent thymidylate synthase